MLKLTILAICFVGVAFADHPNHACMRGPGGKDPSECCEMPSLIDKAIVEKCKIAFPRPSGPPPGLPSGPPPAGAPPVGGPHTGGPKGCCMSECIMNSTGILVNGKVDKIVAQKVMAQNLQGDATWTTIVNNAIDKCQVDAAAKEGEMKNWAPMPTPAGGEQMCNPISGFLIGCVTGEIYKNCPANKYQAGEECDKIKTFVDDCGLLFMK